MASKLGTFGHKLYTGEVSYNIVGNRKRWYVFSAIILLAAIAGLGIRGLNAGIEFKGGAEFVVPASSCTLAQVRDAASAAGVQGAVVTELGNDRIRVQTPALTAEESGTVTQSIATACQVNADDLKVQLVGPSWGGEITKKALIALGVFLLAVTLFLSLYFEWRMAAAALVALAHDLVITVGIYALVGFEVTPATVIGLLTILGFSLYDTVVVFDKVKENARSILGQSRMTYSDAANLAVNQTLVRSINTSIVALLPVASILFVGAGLLGAGTLKDLALALFIGTASGAYSSIFVATPFLCQLKEHQPQFKALAARVAARKTGADRKGVAARDAGGVGATSGKVPVGAAAGGAAVDQGARPARPHRQQQAGPRNQPKKQPRSKRGGTGGGNPPAS